MGMSFVIVLDKKFFENEFEFKYTEKCPLFGYEYEHDLYQLPVTSYTDTRYRPGMYDCNSLYGWNLPISIKSCIRND